MRWLRIWGHHSLCADLLTAHDCLKLIRVFCDSFLLFASSPSVCTLAFVNVSHLSMYSFYIFFFSFALRPHSALVFSGVRFPCCCWCCSHSSFLSSFSFLPFFLCLFLHHPRPLLFFSVLATKSCPNKICKDD